MTKQDTKCCNSEPGKGTETDESSGEGEQERVDN